MSRRLVRLPIHLLIRLRATVDIGKPKINSIFSLNNDQCYFKFISCVRSSAVKISSLQELLLSLMDGNESDGSDSGSEELPTQNRDDHGEADDPDEDGSEASPVHMPATLRQVYYDSEAESVDVEAIEVEEPYDISIAASHSYLGAGLEQARGRRVLEAGWRGRVPVAAHHGVVFPGEVVPMLLPHAADAALIVDAINTHKLFGLLCPSAPGQRRLRALDAAATPWPLFVHDILDFERMRRFICDYFDTMSLGDRLPEEPVSLSFWVASNLPLSLADRLALFAVDNALLRLHMECHFISRVNKSVLCCSSCMTQIARREHLFAMSSEGVHSNYTNLGGYMHDLLTVREVSNVRAAGPSSEEYSWFPGYSWTVAHCRLCAAHVGWRFDATKGRLRPLTFYGICRNYVTPHTDDSAQHL
nr:protein cereblon isoform X2 [Helicoverpa armigera]